MIRTGSGFGSENLPWERDGGRIVDFKNSGQTPEFVLSAKGPGNEGQQTRLFRQDESYFDGHNQPKPAFPAVIAEAKKAVAPR
jgi:hypothetical protein